MEFDPIPTARVHPLAPVGWSAAAVAGVAALRLACILLGLL